MISVLETLMANMSTIPRFDTRYSECWLGRSQKAMLQFFIFFNQCRLKRGFGGFAGGSREISRHRLLPRLLFECTMSATSFQHVQNTNTRARPN